MKGNTLKCFDHFIKNGRMCDHEKYVYEYGRLGGCKRMTQ